MKDAETPDSTSYSTYTSNNGHVDIVKALLEKNAKVDLQDNNGCTALIWASCNGHIDIVKALLEKNAKVDLQNKYGDTALMMASNKGHVDIVNLLKAVRTFIASHPHPCPQQTQSWLLPIHINHGINRLPLRNRL